MRILFLFSISKKCTTLIGNLGATSDVCHIHAYAKEKNYLPDICRIIFCSMLAYILEAFPVYANKITYHMANNLLNVFFFCVKSVQKQYLNFSIYCCCFQYQQKNNKWFWKIRTSSLGLCFWGMESNSFSFSLIKEALGMKLKV